MKKVYRTIVIAVLSILAFIVCYPVIFMLIGSFMGNWELKQYLGPAITDSSGYASFTLLPQQPNIWSYVNLVFDMPEYFVVFWNSAKVAIISLIGQCLFGIMAAWGFAIYNFPFKKVFFNCYIFFMLMPFQVLMLSEYIVILNLNLLDTLWAVILPAVFSTFPVFVLHYFFKDIPTEVLEAARLDGASEFRIFLKIGIPYGKVGICSMLVLSFLEIWNLVEQPLSFLGDPQKWTLSIFFSEVNMDNLGISFASAVVSFIPALFVFWVGKDYLEGGIVATTSIKQQK